MCLVRYAHWRNSAMDVIVVTNHFLFGPPSALDETHGWHSYQEPESVAMQTIGYPTSLLPNIILSQLLTTPHYTHRSLHLSNVIREGSFLKDLFIFMLCVLVFCLDIC